MKFLHSQCHCLHYLKLTVFFFWGGGGVVAGQGNYAGLI